jgi:3-oxoacyl-[acyl-carrier-protein] synthase II
MRVVEAPTAPELHAQRNVGSVSTDQEKLPRVALRAWDLVTPLGADADATWQSLLSGAFITDHARCHGISSALALAQRAAAGIARMADIAADAAVIVGTSKGSVENWLEPGGAAARRQLGLADIAAAVAGEFGIRGPRLTVSAACASGLHALIRGAMLIQSGEARQALVVAAEASVHPLFIGSFQRLGVLARPGVGCRPFDRTRDGFLMSEAAAAVLLEAAPTPDELSGESAAIFLDRFALAGDATHLTAGDPDAHTLRHVLRHVVNGRALDLVHAHGTGTPLNDGSELAAIESAVAAGPQPVLYSHKGALGHSLGAAGLVSVVLNCQAHATGVVPPNVQTRDPLPTRRVLLSRDPVRRRVRRSIALAAGFGGAIAAVSLISR